MASSSRKRLLIGAAKLALVVLVVWGVHRAIGSALAELRAQSWSPAELRPAWLALSAVLYLAALAPSAWFWWRVLQALGQQPTLPTAIRAYYIGHLGKYVPGKALVVVLRTALVRGPRVDTRLAAVSIFYETLSMMACGAFWGSVLLVVTTSHSGMLSAIAAALMLATGIPTLPAVFERLARIAQLGKAPAESLERLKSLGYRTWALGWLAFSAGWAMMGLSLWAILVSGGFAPATLSLADAATCIAAASLAVVAGFLSLVPGGALVREAILLELLGGRYGEAGALVSAILARLVWLMAEIIVSGILYVAGLGRGAAVAQVPAAKETANP